MRTYKKRVLLFILALLVIQMLPAQDYLKTAQGCFNKGDYNCALGNYRNYVLLTPNASDVSDQIAKAEKCKDIQNIANYLYSEKSYDKAIEQYQKLLELNPNDPIAKTRVQQLQAAAHDPVPIEMVHVAGGTFTMGATSEQSGESDDDEFPVHQVTLSAYNIGKYEVTQLQWKQVMGSNPSHFKGDNLPAENVSWEDVQEFISKLNAMTGKKYRLPTEAEWEYAARGGNKSRGYKYSGSNTIDHVAWYYSNSGSTTHAVGAKSPNELGIYDMSGNVYEWCSDWFGTYNASAQTNPRGPSTGSPRVLRGGSWSHNARICRVSNRDYGTPSGRYYFLGFRLAL